MQTASTPLPASERTPGPDDARPVVLVTGAARRIGRVIAHELAAGGWRVALHYRQSLAEAEALAAALDARHGDGTAAIFGADLNDPRAVAALLPQAAARFGRVDALVNNASLFDYDSAFDLTVEQAERHYRANALAPVLLARALAEHLHTAAEAERRGCIVNLLDQKLWNPNPDFFSYTLSKAALQAATTLLAQALAPRVRVCGVAPGITLVSGPMDAAQFERAHKVAPLGRSSTPEDIARAVRFLLEAPAVTGTTLLVDGGQHLLPMARDIAFLTQA